MIPVLPVAAYLACAALALYGFESRRRLLAIAFKPLTTALLLVVVGMPRSSLGWLVWGGVVLSVGGDAALLRASDRAFLVGLGLFLGAHIAYVAAFVKVGSWAAGAWVGLAVTAVATPILLRTLWPRVGALRGPVLVYGAAVSAMVVAAFSTLGGPLPAAPLAAIGALLFYASDSSLAINRFVRPIPRAALYTIGLYWLGQLGIAIATFLHERG
jgi:uncharacterized membrane protein YhhN